MTKALKVIEPGFHTTLQDLGRFGYQAFGVPVSGALDTISLRIANHLVNNRPDQAALEILFSGPTLEVAADSVRVALTGGGIIQQLEPQNQTFGPYRSVYFRRGAVFSVARSLDKSTCAYLAVQGGFDVPAVMGSRSTSVRAAIGGFNGRCLRAGDMLPLILSSVEKGRELVLMQSLPDDKPEEPIRAVLGPQDDHFTTDAIETLFSCEFTVSHEFDRMGIRLIGPKLTHNERGYDILSDAIITGSIQVPGSGQPIILLADHQTTGGYPKIATVISADIPRVGRKGPGSKIRFVRVEVEAAEQIRRRQEIELQKLLASIVLLKSSLESEDLYGVNLVSGVVDASEY